MKAALFAVAAFAGLVIVWEVVAGLGVYNTILLPPPSQSIGSLVKLWNNGILAADLSASASRYMPGLLIGSLVGILAGVMTGVSKNIGYAINPLFHYLRSIPPVALIPFVLVLFGIGDIGKVCLVAWACMFPVWLSTQAGIRQVPKEYIRAAQIFGVHGIKQIVEVWLPCSLPHIVSGLRISVATGFFALAAAEMFAASSGIGFRIVNSHQLFQTDQMVGIILLLGVIALLADTMLSTVRKLVARWET